MAFRKATKFDSKLRMAIAGPAGAGKTWTALTIATGIGGSIALIDTEHGSASKYADRFNFDSQELTNFNPNNYSAAIREAEQGGYAVLIIDSLSHAWTGSGGLMEQKDIIARQKYQGNTFSAWNDATKIQNMLVNTILGCKMHVVVTVRSKMDYILEKDERTGKQVPRKVGLAPVQRDDLPYEFDVFSTMEIDNTMIIDKSRCPELSGQVISRPDEHISEILLAWLAGEPAPVQDADFYQLRDDWAVAYHIAPAQIAERWPKYIQYLIGKEIEDLKDHDARPIIDDLNRQRQLAS